MILVPTLRVGTQGATLGVAEIGTRSVQPSVPTRSVGTSERTTSTMLKELGQIASFIKQAPKIKEELDKFQQRLGQITAEGDAGAGMVRVRVNGRLEILGCTIADEAMGDKELLEDLIKSAVNHALDRARQQVAEEGGRLAGGFGLSGLPDMSGLMGQS